MPNSLVNNLYNVFSDAPTCFVQSDNFLSRFGSAIKALKFS